MVRLKHRYLLCEVKWEKEASKLNISTYILLTAIRENLVSLFGEFGLACVLFSLQVKYWNSGTSLCVIRAPRAHYQMIWNAVTLLNAIENKKASVNVLHVGGTIKLCQRFAIKYDQALLLEEDETDKQEDDNLSDDED